MKTSDGDQTGLSDQIWNPWQPIRNRLTNPPLSNQISDKVLELVLEMRVQVRNQVGRQVLDNVWGQVVGDGLIFIENSV